MIRQLLFDQKYVIYIKSKERISIMIEYLKRKFARQKNKDIETIGFPRYYEEYGILIKELENGEKWEVKLDSKYQEILIKRIK